ncbi:MAG: DEAD/DEAH box helicase [Planctomycetota bacterium]
MSSLNERMGEETTDAATSRLTDTPADKPESPVDMPAQVEPRFAPHDSELEPLDSELEPPESELDTLDSELEPLESELDTLVALESTGLDDEISDDLPSVEQLPGDGGLPSGHAPTKGDAAAGMNAGLEGGVSGELAAHAPVGHPAAGHAGAGRVAGSGDAERDGATPAIPENTFRALHLAEPLLKALAHAGYTEPTPIQAETIPLLLAGRDLLGQAQTGTGKTAAFALPMLQRIELAHRQPQVLVLTPTRELAIQVCEAFAKYAAGMPGFRVAAIYGGQDYMVQFRALDRGVHVIVGTPGRVMDHMRRGSLKLERLRGLVLDEADEMLRMGFAEDVEWILTQVPSERQIALFSATLPEPIRRIAQQHLRNPAEITIQQRTATADTIHQRYIVAHPEQKDEVLHRVLEAETIDGVIVFVKMKSTTEPLADFLCQRGHRAAALNGDMAQGQRERIVEALKAGKLDIVVATDVAARGLDVQRISHVVNFDLPFDSEAYVHRIGRTGRAGRQGEAILLVTPREQGRLRRIEYGTRHPIEPMDPPSNRVINKRRVAKFHQRIAEALARADLATFTSIVDQYRRDKETPLEQIAAALAILACDDKPLLMTGELEPARFPEPRNRRRFEDRRFEEGRFDNRRAPGRRFDERRPDSRRFDDRRYDDRRPDSRGTEDRRFEDRRPDPRSFEDRRFEDRRPEGDADGGRPEGRERREPSDRPDMGRFERPERGGRRSQEPMRSFRVEVGSAHQVKAGNLVGAIANETGMPSNLIGRIAIFDDFSIIDLPARMPRDVFLALREVRVAGKPLNPTPVGGPPRDDRPRSDDRPPYGDRPRSNDRPPFRDRPRSDDRPQYGDRPRSDDRPQYGDRPRFEKKPRFDGKPPRAGKPPFRGKPRRDSDRG